MPEVSCERIEKLLSPFVDGEVTLDESDVVISHIRFCSVCASTYDELGQLKQKLSDLPKILPRRDLWCNIQNSRQKIVNLTIAPRLRISWKQWGIIAASFVIMLFIFVTSVGYFVAGNVAGENINEDLVQFHAFHSEGQPLNDRMAWAFLQSDKIQGGFYGY